MFNQFCCVVLEFTTFKYAVTSLIKTVKRKFRLEQLHSHQYLMIWCSFRLVWSHPHWCKYNPDLQYDNKCKVVVKLSQDDLCPAWLKLHGVEFRKCCDCNFIILFKSHKASPYFCIYILAPLENLSTHLYQVIQLCSMSQVNAVKLMSYLATSAHPSSHLSNSCWEELRIEWWKRLCCVALRHSFFFIDPFTHWWQCQEGNQCVKDWFMFITIKTSVNQTHAHSLRGWRRSRRTDGSRS